MSIATAETSLSPSAVHVRNQRLGILAMVGQTTIASLAYGFTRTAAAEFDPFVLPFLRMCGAGLIFALIFFWRGGLQGRAHTLRDWLKFSLLGLLGISINQAAYMIGLKYTTSANGAVLYAMTPLIVLLFSVWFLRIEQFSVGKVAGIAIALVGVSLVLFARGVSTDDALMRGNLIMLCGVCSWSLYIALSKKWLQGYDPIQATALIMMLGTVMYAPVGLWRIGDFDPSRISLKAWIAFAYVTLFMSVVMYVLLTFALSKIESSQVSIFMNAQPVGAALFGVLFFGESLTWNVVIGGALTIAGIYTMQRAQLGR
ncbi:MAG: DMT family transporter [Chloroherpetonaceae bacterium]|nr:DMT family transporter [Chloroherpetonaceae bacterium]MDW8467140.1 DMT family transporter [Chloroherpetonaceae bacterium]